MKRFRILSSRYRNRHRRIGLRANLIAGLLNYDRGLGDMGEVQCNLDKIKYVKAVVLHGHKADVNVQV